MTADAKVINGAGEVSGEIIPEALMVDIWGNPQGVVNGVSNVVNMQGDVITAILPGGSTDKNYSLLRRGTVISFNGGIIGHGSAQRQYYRIRPTT